MSNNTAFARKQRRLAIPFVLVAFVLYTGLFIVPTGYSIYASFTDWNGIEPPTWTGFANYLHLAADPVFQRSFLNTIAITVGVGIVLFVLSFVLLLVIREMRFSRFIRGALFIPHLVSTIVLAIFWGVLFRFDGLVNTLLGAVGIPPVAWMGPDSAFLFVLLGLIWIHLGYYVTILMAGVDAIPVHYYEAALLDGAGAWQRFRNVTLPLAWDVISVAAVLWTISSVKIFEFILAFSGGQGNLPNVNQWNTALFVYGKTLGGTAAAFQFGYASAAAVVTLLFVGILVVILRRVMRRETIQF